MKHLYIIGGTMGVGKTTVCRILKEKLEGSVFLDGDWCWDMHPFQVTEEMGFLSFRFELVFSLPSPVFPCCHIFRFIQSKDLLILFRVYFRFSRKSAVSYSKYFPMLPFFRQPFRTADSPPAVPCPAGPRRQWPSLFPAVKKPCRNQNHPDFYRAVFFSSSSFSRSSPTCSDRFLLHFSAASACPKIPSIISWPRRRRPTNKSSVPKLSNFS